MQANCMGLIFIMSLLHEVMDQILYTMCHIRDTQNIYKECIIDDCCRQLVNNTRLVFGNQSSPAILTLSLHKTFRSHSYHVMHM